MFKNKKTNQNIVRLCISQFQLRPRPPPPHPTPFPLSGYCGAFARLVSPGSRAFANFVLSGERAFANPGPFPSFWHTRGFLSEFKYTEGFTGKKKKQIGSSVKGRNKLKRVEKAFSRFLCMHFFIASLHSANRSYRCKSTFLVIESNFCWYDLKNILSYLENYS